MNFKELNQIEVCDEINDAPFFGSFSRQRSRLAINDFNPLQANQRQEESEQIDTTRKRLEFNNMQSKRKIVATSTSPPLSAKAFKVDLSPKTWYQSARSDV